MNTEKVAKRSMTLARAAFALMGAYALMASAFGPNHARMRALISQLESTRQAERQFQDLSKFLYPEAEYNKSLALVQGKRPYKQMTSHELEMKWRKAKADGDNELVEALKAEGDLRQRAAAMDLFKRLYQDKEARTAKIRALEGAIEPCAAADRLMDWAMVACSILAAAAVLVLVSGWISGYGKRASWRMPFAHLLPMLPAIPAIVSFGDSFVPAAFLIPALLLIMGLYQLGRFIFIVRPHADRGALQDIRVDVNSSATAATLGTITMSFSIIAGPSCDQPWQAICGILLLSQAWFLPKLKVWADGMVEHRAWLVSVATFPYHFVMLPFRMQTRRFSTYDTVLFCRQMAVLTRAGHSLPAGIRAVAGDMTSASLKMGVLDIADRVEAGMSLSGALSEHPEHFDDYFVTVVRSGEKTGDMGWAFNTLSEWWTRREGLVSSLASAMTYPAIIGMIASLLGLFLMVKVVPTFKEVFSAFGADLPLPTRVVIYVSDLFVYNSALIVLAVVTLGGALKLVGRKRMALLTGLVCRLPGIGTVLSNAYIGRFGAVLTLLLDAKVPLVEALKMAAPSAGPLMTPAIMRLARLVEKGGSIAESLRDDRVMPDLFKWFLRNGEANNDLEANLKEASEIFADRAASSNQVIPELAAAAVIMFAAFCVGLLVLAMYMPMFQMGSMAG